MQLLHVTCSDIERLHGYRSQNTIEQLYESGAYDLDQMQPKQFALHTICQFWYPDNYHTSTVGAPNCWLSLMDSNCYTCHSYGEQWWPHLLHHTECGADSYVTVSLTVSFSWAMIECLHSIFPVCDSTYQRHHSPVDRDPYLMVSDKVKENVWLIW